MTSPLFIRRALARGARRVPRRAGPHPEIPAGDYCYVPLGWREDRTTLHVQVCPHWHLQRHKPEQANGYCRLLRLGDADPGSGGLLWDQVKACSHNLGDAE